MNERNLKIDFIKGALMLGVVWGHFINAFNTVTTNTSILHLLVRTYDMPFFMLIGGYLLVLTSDRYTLGKGILNKISKIARPTIMLGGGFALITYAVTKSLSLLNIIKYISGIWFMWSFFICSVLVITISKLFASITIQIALAIGIQIILHCIPGNPWNLSYMFPFFAIGYFIPALKCDWERKINKKNLAICAMVYLLLFSFWNNSFTVWNANGYLIHNQWLTQYLISLYRFFIGMFGCLCFYEMCEAFLLLKFECVNRFIARIGKESMTVYIVHSFLVAQCFATIIEKIGEYSVFSSFIDNNFRFIIVIVTPLLTIITCWIIVLVTEWLKKNKTILRFVFGQKH